MNPQNPPVTALTGIGAKTARHLQKLGIVTIPDLLLHLPHRYEDRTRLCAIGELDAGASALVCGKIEFAEVLPKGRRSLICRISDGTGCVSLRFFHFTASQLQILKPNIWLTVYAETRHGYAGLEMVHPEYRVVAGPDQVQTDPRLTPVYPLTEGLSQQTVRKAVQQALAWCEQHPDALPDWLPPALLQHHGYPALIDAIGQLHAPEATAPMAALLDGSLPALQRLAFEELLAHHLSLAEVKYQARQRRAPVFTDNERETAHFLAALPFELTGAQRRVIAEIERDCRQSQPMMRLVQGDVGSGKTVVAAYAALLALSAGYQVALMAPTELLAEQHYRNFCDWLADFSLPVLLLTGQTRNKQRAAVLATLADGGAAIVMGTHALFQDSVAFARLGLVIIDEQHRFGVHQRLALREKAQGSGLRPHQLVMTATPIPRTLAMLRYSDLDISIIDELPPGRKPVVTSVIPAERRADVIERIDHWVNRQRQAYWVCTLIDESETLQCQAAEQTAELLKQNLPKVRIGLIHGRMKAGDKDSVMQAFKRRELDLLVATTVIEVGVDVPNAGLMIIENPERLGLSQLHQLRGRVGRGQGDSYCLLMYQAPLSDTARQRLGILRDSQDGFVIAEQDLQLRGPGDVLGTRQTGQMLFKIADLRRDAALLDAVQQAGEHFFAEQADAIQPLCRRWLGVATIYSEV